MSECDHDVLSRYLDAQLTLPVRRALEQHLLSCAACRRELENLRRMDALLLSWGSRRDQVPTPTEARILTSVERRRLRPVLALSRVMPAALGSGIAAVLVMLSANLGFMYQSASRSATQTSTAQVAHLIQTQSRALQNARRTAAIVGVRTASEPNLPLRRPGTIHVD